MTKKTFIEKVIYSISIESTIIENVNSIVQTTIDKFITIVLKQIQKMLKKIRTLTFFLFSNSLLSNINFINSSKDFDSRFLFKKFELFFSDYKEKIVVKENFIKNISENIIYCNVHVFIN